MVFECFQFSKCVCVCVVEMYRPSAGQAMSPSLWLVTRSRHEHTFVPRVVTTSGTILGTMNNHELKKIVFVYAESMHWCIDVVCLNVVSQKGRNIYIKRSCVGDGFGD